ncbi:hypothetical protein E2C01_081891 [Portunus trituberculatus]|uniref:Uncharacterized protein n=1 Tax=Portunus trituberculatus TaxID=210409 RepID=A0A5B7IXU2_PORTR|nr:hypothetical protein [Portunus trituberculatus]
MNNLILICQTSRTSLHGVGVCLAGTWSEETQCPTGLVVCGMRLRAEIPHVYDDTCINDMVVMCCIV